MSTNKVFSRDPINNILGGVCAGLANYLGLDRWIIRLIFLALIFLWGFIIPIYIVLWLAMPKSIANISDSPKISSGSFLDAVSALLVGVVQLITRFFGKIIGFVLIVGLIISLLFGWSILSGFEKYWTVLLENQADFILFKYSFILLLIISSCIILVIAFWLMSKKIKFSKVLFALFVGGLIFSSASMAYFIFKASSLFEKKLVTSQAIPISIPFDSTFNLISSQEMSLQNTYSFSNENGFVLGNFAVLDSGIYSGNVVLSILPSAQNEAKLDFKLRSFGKDSLDALRNQKELSYDFNQLNRDLIVSPYFKIPRSSKWRNQQVYLALHIPIGCKVRLIENIVSTIEMIGLPEGADMESLIGKDLIMTPKGLVIKSNFF